MSPEDREIGDLRAEWRGCTDQIEAISARLERENRTGRPDEVEQFTKLRVKAESLQTRVQRLESEREERQTLIRQARNQTLAPDGNSRSRHEVRVSGEPRVYERHDRSGRSFFMDLANAGRGDFAAQERLHRHARELAVEKRVDLSSTLGQGGDFEPPIWLMAEWTKVIRMGRPFADSLNNQGAPPEGASINIPRLVTGTAAAAQADLGVVQQTDATTGSFSVPIKTLAGQAKIAQQLVDRSAPGIDSIIFDDLLADYNLRLDLGVLSGSGSGANIKGVLSDTNRITVTCTQATPAVGAAGGFYAKVADATQQVITLRGLAPDTIAMHPRRWAWVLAASDSTGRPLLDVGGQGDLQSPGTAGVVNQLGNAGFTFQGLAVVVDANLPTNLGAATNEDTVLVYRAQDLYLWESAPVMRAFPQTFAGNLEVLLQCFAYAAFTSERYSKSTAQLTGSQLVSPTY